MISRSKKLSAAALTSTTASPGPGFGSGMSASSKSSGVPKCVHRTAFMGDPSFRGAEGDAPETHKHGSCRQWKWAAPGDRIGAQPAAVQRMARNLICRAQAAVGQQALEPRAGKPKPRLYGAERKVELLRDGAV